MTTELNVKIDITTLANLIDAEIENFKHYQVSVGKSILDVFHHIPTNNLFYIGRQFAEALEYKDPEQVLKLNVESEDKIHLKHKQANKLLSLEINSLARPCINTGSSDNSLINNDKVEIFKSYKLNPNGCLFIAEEGAMDLLMDSHKPEAKAFRRKLIEIAVTIRQTGSYGISNNDKLSSEVLSAIVNNSSVVANAMLRWETIVLN